MIDLRTINRANFNSDEECYNAKMDAVDSNWREIKTLQTGENPDRQNKRFIKFKLTEQFRTHMVRRRVNESIPTWDARLSNIRDTEDRLKYGVSEYFMLLAITKNQRDTFKEHCYRLFAFEETDKCKEDIIGRRPGESEEDHRKRLLKFHLVKKKIIENVDNEIKQLLERKVDDDEEEESLKDWKEGVTKAIEDNLDFLKKVRRITTQNNRLENIDEVRTRLDGYYNVIIKIDKLIFKKELDDKFDDIKERERRKHQAKQEIEDETLAKQQEELKKERKDRIDESKPVLFLGLTFSISFILIIAYGFDAYISAVFNYGIYVVGFIVIISFWFHHYKGYDYFTIIKTIFNGLINCVYWPMKCLNFALNSVGMSVTDKKEF
jgi:hypothetical protein